MPAVNPWFNGKLVIRPGDKVVGAGNSITVTGPQGYLEEIQNVWTLLYGASAPTLVLRGTPGASMTSYLAGGSAATVVADAPNVIITELGENGVIADAAAARTQALALIDYYAANLPGVRQAWAMSIWSGGTELWGPSPNATRIGYVMDGVASACRDRGIPFLALDVRNRFLQAMVDLNSPAQGVASGITTSDGLHPNWRGRPMLGVAARRQIHFEGITNAPPDYSVWLPNADVTPALWMEADQLSLADNDPVATWGPWSAAGSARPTYKAAGWYNGMPCVRSDGVANIMTAAGLSTPSGAKTIFAVYKPAAYASVLGEFQVLTNLKVSSGVYTQICPTYNFGANYVETDIDCKSNFSEGFFTIGTSQILEGATLFPVRLGATFAGGSSTDVANYNVYWGGGSLAMTLTKRNSGSVTPSATAPTTLFGRMDNGVALDSMCGCDLAALLVYPGVLTAVQYARVDQYLRRKWGP